MSVTLAVSPQRRRASVSVAHHHDAHDRPVSQVNRVPARNIGHRRYLRQCPGHAIHSAPDAYGFFLLRQWRRRRPCVRGGVIDEIARSWRPPAVTPTSRPKPRGISNAIDGGAHRGHGLVRRGRARGDEARAVEFGRRQNHLRWGHRRSGLRLGVMEGHSNHQNGLPCVGSLGSEVPVPGPRARVWYSSQRNG